MGPFRSVRRRKTSTTRPHAPFEAYACTFFFLNPLHLHLHSIWWTHPQGQISRKLGHREMEKKLAMLNHFCTSGPAGVVYSKHPKNIFFSIKKLSHVQFATPGNMSRGARSEVLKTAEATACV